MALRLQWSPAGGKGKHTVPPAGRTGRAEETLKASPSSSGPNSDWLLQLHVNGIDGFTEIQKLVEGYR